MMGLQVAHSIKVSPLSSKPTAPPSPLIIFFYFAREHGQI